MSKPLPRLGEWRQFSTLCVVLVGLGCGDSISSSNDGRMSATAGTSGSTTLLSRATDDEVPPIDCAEAVEIDGDLLVGEDRPHGLAARHVRGNVRVSDTIDRTDLDHLRCLVEVDGDLVIESNFGLTDVSGLNSLERVGGSLVFSGNEALVSVGPLPGVRELGRLALRSNPELTHFDLGVSRLVLGSRPADPERAASVDVLNNDRLERFSMGVDEVRSDSEVDIRFGGNETLSRVDVSVFADLRVRRFEVTDSPSLHEIRFGGTELERLRLEDNPLLLNLEGFGALEAVDSLVITPAQELEDLRDLSSLRDVSFLAIGQCLAGDGGGVRSLDGLQRLRGVQTLVIASNPVLEDISALSTVELSNAVAFLMIQDNPRLTAAAIGDAVAGLGVDPRVPEVCGSLGTEPCDDPPSACGLVF